MEVEVHSEVCMQPIARRDEESDDDLTVVSAHPFFRNHLRTSLESIVDSYVGSSLVTLSTSGSNMESRLNNYIDEALAS